MQTSSLPKILLFSLLSLVITHSCSHCLDSQKSLLLNLKNELIFNSSYSQKLMQWNQTSDCCNWRGVECDGAGYVKSLQLDDEGISGGFGNSSSLFKLKYLEKLNLAFNEFENLGIPREIGNLTYLTHLDFSMASFGGQVPLELSLLTRLVSLDISTYSPIKLELTIFQNLTRLGELYLDGVDISSQKREWSYIMPSYSPNLTSLSLCGCNLLGPLDKSLSQLHSLSSLRLDDNDLSSVVPDWFVNFSNLTTLTLSYCSLRGYFPTPIFLIPTLQNLDLSENALLSGSVPPFTQFGSLKSIVLSDTNFSGLIPSSIGNIKTLSVLDLGYCKFTGLIPSTLANLTQLIKLNLIDNFFTGSLPSTLFTGFPNLEVLELGYNSFTGNIPPSLFGLPSLQKIFLSGNRFTGQVEEFPVVNLSNIASIHLIENRLEGPIPNSFYELQSLVDLLLSNNLFSGTFQLEKIRRFPSLKILDISNNLFSGTFQLEKIRRFPSLEILDISNNFLSVNSCSSSTGFPSLKYLGLASCNLREFPVSLKHINWTRLDLSNNQISGEIPSWIWGNGRNIMNLNLSCNLLKNLQSPYYIPTSLETLDLHSNQLTGELHLQLSFPPRSYLQFLYAANNSFMGSIPTSLCNAKQLAFLDLSVNKLSGCIPPCLSQNMDDLQVLNLGRNKIGGSIPRNISQNCGLEILDLNNNTLDGSIPNSLENCKSLTFVNVGNNILHGNFPCMLSSSLRVLVLRSNRLEGEVRCQKSWPDIQILDISSNNFGANLGLVNFSSWRAMVLESDPGSRPNRLLQPSSLGGIYRVVVRITMKDNELELVKIFPDFTSIDFSCNNFQGEIPDAIGDLQSLRFLNLSHNSLTSRIPKSLGAMTLLESLDLSANHLTGAIPVELADITFLSFLNVSYNKLVGKIPNGRQFQTFSADKFEGNSGLCGFPLNRSCTKKTDVNEVNETEEIEWEYVSAAVGYVVGLGIIVWLLLFCRSFREKYFNKIDEVVEDVIDGRNRRRRHGRRRLGRRG